MKIYQVFEEYSLFYQPYIPPVLKMLNTYEGFNCKVMAFKGKSESENHFILPSYYHRLLKEKFNYILRPSLKPYNYLSQKAILEKVDIIHLQHSFLFSKIIPLLNLPTGQRPKVVITLRGGDTYIKPWIMNKWKNFYEIYGNKVDAFIAMSENQKQYLQKWGVSQDKIFVIPISFGKRFNIVPKSPNQNKLKLVSVFRMCWEKNITGNFEFVRKMKEMSLPFAYDIYGDGHDIGQVYYLRDKFNLHNEVNIHGKVDNEILKNKLRDYDFILQLSSSESLGMTVIEAQSLGLPAVISNSDGLPETIINNKTGLIVDKYNILSTVEKLYLIWSNKEIYEQYSFSAIENSHMKFSIENEVEKLHNLYKTLS